MFKLRQREHIFSKNLVSVYRAEVNTLKNSGSIPYEIKSDLLSNKSQHAVRRDPEPVQSSSHHNITTRGTVLLKKPIVEGKTEVGMWTQEVK